MPKIVFVNRFFFPDTSATSQLLSDLCFGLQQSGFDVCVISSRQRYEYTAQKALLPVQETVRRVQIFRCRGTYFGRGVLLGRTSDYFSFYIASFFCLFRIANRGDIVVTMTDPPLLGAFLGLALKWRGAVQINWLQDLFPEVAEALGFRGVRGIAGRLLRYLRDRNCRSAYMNVVIGQDMAVYLKGRGIGDNQIALISNWAPLGLEPVTDEENFLRSEWGLGEKFVVGYSGNLGHAHDRHTLLKAVTQLSVHSDIRFLFIGGGVGMDVLRAEAHARQLDNIDFKPYQPRECLSESLSVIDLHLVSLQPGLSSFLVPSKLYGIAAVGRPALFIGPADCEVAEHLREHGYGKTVPNGDAAGLVREILAMAFNPEDYVQACAGARQAHRDHYGVRRGLESWAQLLKSPGLAFDK